MQCQHSAACQWRCVLSLRLVSSPGSCSVASDLTRSAVLHRLQLVVLRGDPALPTVEHSAAGNACKDWPPHGAQPVLRLT